MLDSLDVMDSRECSIRMNVRALDLALATTIPLETHARYWGERGNTNQERAQKVNNNGGV